MITKIKAVSSTPFTHPARIVKMRVGDIVVPSTFTSLYGKRSGEQHVKALSDLVQGSVNITPIVIAETRQAINNHAELSYLHSSDPNREIDVQLVQGNPTESQIAMWTVADVRKTGRTSLVLSGKEIQILLNEIGKRQGQRTPGEKFDRITVIQEALGLKRNFIKQMIKVLETSPNYLLDIDIDQEKGDGSLTLSEAFANCTRVTQKIKELPEYMRKDIGDMIYAAQIAPDKVLEEEMINRGIKDPAPASAKSRSNTTTNYFTNIPKIAINKPINTGEYDVEDVCDLLFMNIGLDDTQYSNFKARLVKLLSDSLKK